MKRYEGKTNGEILIKVGNDVLHLSSSLLNVFSGSSSSGNPKVQISGSCSNTAIIEGVKYTGSEKFFVQINIIALNQEAQEALKDLMKQNVVKSKAKEITI